MQALVDRHVKDEVLYREAVALGFDREDPALRRRLATKLESLARDVGAAVEPTEAELQAFLDAHAAFSTIFRTSEELDPRRAVGDTDPDALLRDLRN